MQNPVTDERARAILGPSPCPSPGPSRGPSRGRLPSPCPCPSPSPSGRPEVQAQLSVRGGAAAVAFYRAAFGAEEVFRVEADVGGGASEVVAQLGIGATRFWVEDESPEHANFSPQSLGGATERMLLVVDDPRAVVARAVACGARLVRPVAEEHGWLLGRVVDPAGHHWEIGMPLAEWPPRTNESEV